MTSCALGLFSLLLAHIIQLSGNTNRKPTVVQLNHFPLFRRSRAKRRAERRLTIQREKNKQNVNGGLNGPAAVPEGAYNTRKSQITERSDSGLQTDLDLEDTNLNEFDVTMDSPTDNQSAYTSDFQMSVDDEIEG